MSFRYLVEMKTDSALGRSSADGGAHQSAGVAVNLANDVLAYDLERQPLASRREADGATVTIECNASPIVLFGTMRVPGWGNPWIYADNDRRGFAPGVAPVDFPKEAARTRIREIRELTNSLAAEGMPVPGGIAERLDEARALAGSDPIRALALAIGAGEELVAAETAWREARGRKEDFLLGVCLKPFANGGKAFRDAASGVFNLGTIPLTWGILEPEPGKPRYDVIDDMVEWCEKEGIRMKGHALVWHSWWERVFWHKDLTFREFLARSLDRAREIMTRYADRFELVELINEPVQQGYGWRSVEEIVEETVAVHSIIRECSPKTRVMVSFFDEEESWFARTCHFPPGDKAPIPVWDFIHRITERGVRLDAIGMQRHIPTGLFDTRMVVQRWQREFRLPVHITELIIPSSAAAPGFQVSNRPMAAPDRIWRDRPWTEQTQADWFSRFLPFFHAMPGVAEATVWGAADAGDLWHDYLIGTFNERYRLPWMNTQGLFREDYSRKPAFDTIARLSAGWGLRRRK